jgi:tripartite-type tricarboxylate transporter receptor subunit TctC
MHKVSRRQFCALPAILFITGSTRTFAASESYPNRPITIICPSAPGGQTDIVSRLVAEELGKRLNITVTVLNREGAGGTLGMTAAARAPADGYTLILTFQGPTTVAPALYPDLQYDPMQDFVAVSPISTTNQFLTVGPSAPFKNLKEVIDAAKQQPGKISYGTSGVGSTAHLAGELLQQQVGIKLNHIPYKGESHALRDVAGGLLDMTFSTLAGTKALADAGRVHMIAVTTANRAAAAPDIPTFDESGVKGYNVPTWFGVLAPSKTPPDIVARLQKECSSFLKDPDVRERVLARNIEPWLLEPTDFQQWLRDDTVRWSNVIKAANIKPA